MFQDLSCLEVPETTDFREFFVRIVAEALHFFGLDTEADEIMID